MHSKKGLFWLCTEAIIIDIIIASFVVIVILSSVNILFGKDIKTAINILDLFSIDTNSATIAEIKFDEENKEITKFPEYGTRYANIRIESLGINLPLYYGDKLETLRNGIGHSSGSYFPGEGGSILCMGHNTKAFLHDLPKIKKKDKIVVTTTYGEFTYKVYDTKIVNMYNVDEAPIQKEEEIFMLYTCYPVDGLGHKKDRFIVYAKLVQ